MNPSDPASEAPEEGGNPSSTRPVPIRLSGGSSVRATGLPGGENQATVISQRPPWSPALPLGAPTPSELGQLMEGQQLDHFQIERFIGGGGMGAVFRARDTRLNRLVALKVLSPACAADQETVLRFLNEAQSAARLDHEHIARVYYVGEDQGLHFIAFEYIDGTNIRDLVEAEGPLLVADALRYTLQLAQALEHASSRDVVHRDIKPSNVLVAAAGQVKLVDMGLARLHQVQRNTDLTASGVTLGTFDYISPEQARDPRSADVRSDIYSLGCTLYFMLTARPPFPEGTVLQKLLQHQGDEPPDPRAIRPDLPLPVCRVLSKMLAKDPRERYQTPGTLLSDLVLVAEHLGLPLASPWPALAVAPSRWTGFWDRHLPWLAPIAALVAVVALLDLTGRLPMGESRTTRIAPQEFASSFHPGPTAAPDLGPQSSGFVDEEPSPDAGPGRSDRRMARPLDSDGQATPARPQPRRALVGEEPGPSEPPPSGEAAPPAAQVPGEPPRAARSTESLAGPSGAAGTAASPLPAGTVGLVPPAPPRATPAAPSATTTGQLDLPGASQTVELGWPGAEGGIGLEPSGETQVAALETTPDSSLATGPTAPPDLPPGPTQPPDTAEALGGAGASSLRQSGLLIVNPRTTTEGEFTSLRAALAMARSGDVIELRFSGPHDERPLTISNLQLTIRAGTGFHPRLRFRPALGDPVTHPRSSLAIHGGRLTLIHLTFEVELPVEQSPVEGWSWLLVDQVESIRLDGCWVTLSNAQNDRTALHPQAALIRLAGESDPLEADDTALIPGRDTPAASGLSGVEIQLTNCVLRGEASVLVNPQRLPFRFRFSNGLCAADQWLVDLGESLGGVPPISARMEWDHLTAWCGQGLIRIPIEPGSSSLAQVLVDCSNSLLLGPEQAAVVEQACSAAPGPRESWLRWNGQRNLFQGFSAFWRAVAPDRDLVWQETRWSDWKLFWRGGREQWGAIGFRESIPQQPVHRWEPSDFLLQPGSTAQHGATDGDDAGLVAARLPWGGGPPPADGDGAARAAGEALPPSEP